MTDRRMYRYAVPIDDQAHPLILNGQPAAVACGGGQPPNFYYLEFWAECDDAKPDVRRWYQVFGTGHDLPSDATWVGTPGRDRLGMVWHLYEVPEPDDAPRWP